jgi:hypothetical protein
MKNICISSFILFFSFSLNVKTPKPLYEPAAGPFSIIAKSGKAKAQIMVPNEPTYLEEFAASELQKYFLKISDAKFPIVKEGNISPYSFSFFIGNTEKAIEAGLQPNEEKMGRDGFELKSVKKGLIIQGKNDMGTLFGVYELLERYFDVRWFMPDEEYYPKYGTLKIGIIDLIYKPSFNIRWVGGGEWSLRHRMNTAVSAGGKRVGTNIKWHYHTYPSYLMPPDIYYYDHPEYFTLLNGERQIFTDRRNQGNQLCTSNPDVVREIAMNLVKTLDAESEIDIISFAPDDNTRFCECENCVALDEPGRDWFGRHSNRIAIFNNEVAKIVKIKHPNVLIKVGTYEMYMRPPLSEDYKPESNLLFQLTHLWFCHNHHLGSDLCKAGETYEPKDRFLPNQEFEKVLDQWSKISPNLFIYEYYWISGMNRANLPWPMIHTMRSDIPFYRNKGVESFYTQADFYSDNRNLFYRLGLNYYVAAKLTWNADLNVDALLDDYFQKFYGPAADPAKDYFMAMEESMQEWNGCVSYGLTGVAGIREIGPKIFTPEVMEKMGKSLASAERLSSYDETSSRRVALMRQMYEETKVSLKEIEGN